MQDLNNEKVKDQLKENLDTVNHWLSFAEAKILGLVAFNIACIAAILTINCINILFCVIIFGFVVSIIVALFYTIPLYKTRNKDYQYAKNKNLLFYKNIADYSKEEYLKDLYQRYYNVDLKTEKMKRIELDYSEEIVENARIACKKYQGVDLAIKIDIISLVLILLEIIFVA